MKIGIITFWDSSDNYGQLLQGFALQQYLISKGNEVHIIRYKAKKNITFWEKVKKLHPAYILTYFRYKRKAVKTCSIIRNFDTFRRDYMHYSDRIYNRFDELWNEDWSSFDAFICGSDQIWSPKPKEELDAYFLKFAPLRCLRIAYAPSFGRQSLTSEYQKELHELLRHFNAISVREKEGVHFCENAGYNAKLVCDPTLLHEVRIYKELTNTTGRERSAFCYLINWNTNIPIQEIKDYVKEQSYDVHFFCTEGHEAYFSYENDQSIQNWLSCIQKCRIAFTNSFHGTVFSILHHTPFVVFPLSDDAKVMNNRLYSLLDRLGLMARIYKEGMGLREVIESDIDWDDVDKKLDDFRASSKIFLDQAFIPKKYSLRHRICFLTRSSIHHNYGGLDRVTETLAHYFQEQGSNVFFVSQQRRKVTHEKLQHYLPNKTKWKSQENIDWLNNFLEEKSIDILINQEGNVDLTLPINIKVRKITVLHFNPNYIDDKHFYNKIRCYSFPFYHLFLFLSHSFLNKLGLFYLRNKLAKNYYRQLEWADEFILLSDKFRSTLGHLLHKPFKQYKVLAINNPLILPDDYEKETLHKEKILLYVGRIDNSFKNVDKLVRIWARIAADVPEWKMLICGDGPDFQSLQTQIEQEKTPRVELLGQQEPTNYYKKSSIIMMASSSSEGWGMALVEAMSYGCVPIALDSYAALSDIIQNGYNGVIVGKTNSFEKLFSQKLLQLIMDDNMRQQMSSHARDCVKDYDIRKIGQQWLKLMEK